MSAAYRVWQFVRAAGAWVQAENLDGEGAHASPHPFLDHLPRRAARLFQAMPPHDRRHALAVARTLQEQGHTDPDLLAAALLHDAGKTGAKTDGRPGALRLWRRVAVVLMRAFWPGLLERISQDQAENWRRPFFVLLHHAAIGAELAREAGCSPVTVELIRRHEDPPDQAGDPLLAVLQAADSVN